MTSFELLAYVAAFILCALFLTLAFCATLVFGKETKL